MRINHIISPLNMQEKWHTFFNKYGASTSSLHLLSMLCTAPSSLLYSDNISLPRKTGIIWQVGKRFSYACGGKNDALIIVTHKTISLW